ncbi:thermoresistant gluconokinase [Moniliophthora roreri MCA 2997]|uniref:Gluconokinase n=2 Tax=Moniliophthora roreri TaxID=221103 RepID=V2XGQ8_MONRO|nr:thermoresistant gluconokinase [Moniliophthora roreri MCA 2997]KAI3609601.1 thermoresistant gluconokinase [Moniliophthora roreri]
MAGTQTGERKPVLIIAMGVSGTGKSTLGQAIAKDYGLAFIEGDELHPKANIDKMASGQPLNDVDREPWLELIRTTAEHKIAEMRSSKELRDEHEVHGVVVTCSSLKKYYRDILRGKRKEVKESDEAVLPAHLEPPSPEALPTIFVFLKGSREVLFERMSKRQGHYMKANMLDSQLQTLESPEDEEGVITVSIMDSTETQLQQVKEALKKTDLTP